MDLAVSIRHHLGFNHYPPIHSDFDACAIEAIEQAIDAQDAEDFGDYERAREILDQIITMPNGVDMTVQGIIAGLHLHDFVRELSA